jgi:hypothetical protein
MKSCVIFACTIISLDRLIVLHDFLYENNIELGYDQEFCDNEMKLWSEILNGTKNISLRNLDNTIRFLAVKWFGKKVFNKNKK